MKPVKWANNQLWVHNLALRKKKFLQATLSIWKNISWTNKHFEVSFWKTKSTHVIYHLAGERNKQTEEPRNLADAIPVACPKAYRNRTKIHEMTRAADVWSTSFRLSQTKRCEMKEKQARLWRKKKGYSRNSLALVKKDELYWIKSDTSKWSLGSEKKMKMWVKKSGYWFIFVSWNLCT